LAIGVCPRSTVTTGSWIGKRKEEVEEGEGKWGWNGTGEREEHGNNSVIIL